MLLPFKFCFYFYLPPHVLSFPHFILYIFDVFHFHLIWFLEFNFPNILMMPHVNVQFLHLNSFLNISRAPNCLFIIEITVDFKRIKWQLVKILPLVRKKPPPMISLRPHYPLLVSPVSCRQDMPSCRETSGIPKATDTPQPRNK